MGDKKTPAFNVRTVYKDALALVKGASYMNGALTDKLRDLVPREVANAADTRRISDYAVLGMGLPQGTVLSVQQMSEGLGVYSVESVLTSAENAGAVDGSVVDVEVDTETFSAAGIKTVLEAARAKLGWVGEIAATGTAVDIGGLKDREGGSQILWGSHLSFIFAPKREEGGTGYEAARTTMSIVYRPERRDEKLRVEQSGGAISKATAVDREFFLSYVRVMIAEALKRLSDAQRKDARLATCRSTSAVVANMLQAVGQINPAETLATYLERIIMGFESISLGVEVNAADKDVLQLFWFNLFKKLKTHHEEFKGATLMGEPTPYLEKFFRSFETGPTTTAEVNKDVSQLTFDYVTTGAGHYEEESGRGRFAEEGGEPRIEVVALASATAESGSGGGGGNEDEKDDEDDGDSTTQSSTSSGSDWGGRGPDYRGVMQPMGPREPPTPMEKRKADNEYRAAEKKRRAAGGEVGRARVIELGEEERRERRLAIRSISRDPDCPYAVGIWKDRDFRNMLDEMYRLSNPDPRTGEMRECEENWFKLMISVIPILLRKMVANMQVFFRTLPLALIAQHNQGAHGQGGRGGYPGRPQIQPRGAPSGGGGVYLQPRGVPYGGSGGYPQPRGVQNGVGGGHIQAVEAPAGGRGRGASMASQQGGRGSQHLGMPPGYMTGGRGFGGVGYPARGVPGRGRGRGDAGQQPYAGRAAMPYGARPPPAGYYGPAAGGRVQFGALPPGPPAPRPQQQPQQQLQQPQQQQSALQPTGQWQEQQSQLQQGAPARVASGQPRQTTSYESDFTAGAQFWTLEAKDKQRGAQGEIMALASATVEGTLRFAQKRTPSGQAVYVLTRDDGDVSNSATKLCFLRNLQPCVTVFLVRGDLALLATNVMTDSGAGTSVATPAAIRALTANGVKLEVISVEQKVTFGGMTNGMSYPPVAKVVRLYMMHGTVGVQLDFGLMGADTDPARLVIGSQFMDTAGQVADSGRKETEWNIGGLKQKYTFELRDPTILDPGDTSISRAYALRIGAGRAPPTLEQIAAQRLNKGWWTNK